MVVIWSVSWLWYGISTILHLYLNHTRIIPQYYATILYYNLKPYHTTNVVIIRIHMSN